MFVKYACPDEAWITSHQFATHACCGGGLISLDGLSMSAVRAINAGRCSSRIYSKVPCVGLVPSGLLHMPDGYCCDRGSPRRASLAVEDLVRLGILAYIISSEPNPL